MVRSASQNEDIKSELLESLQRLNVAITRAKYKLIMGNVSLEKKKSGNIFFYMKQSFAKILMFFNSLRF